MSSGYMGYMGYIRHGMRILYKGAMMPEYVTFFVTSRCNLRCSHCFYWKSVRDPCDELSLDEIRRISKNMGNILVLNLTGGEPTLRDDLPEIAEIFYRSNKVLNLVIPTNGFMTEKIVTVMEKVLWLAPGANVTIDISLDDMGMKHDGIRGVPRSFENAVSTFRKLTSLKKRYANLNVGISMTLMKENQNGFEEVYGFVRDDLKPDSISLAVIRGDVKDKQSKDVSLKRFEEISKMMSHDAKRGRVKGYGGFPFSSLTATIGEMVREDVAKTIRKGKSVMPCLSGQTNAVIYPSGDVFFCELLDMKLGNLRQAGYDFRKVWYSGEAEQIRKFIRRSGCFCIHDCNMYTNILFSPSHFSKALVRRICSK